MDIKTLLKKYFKPLIEYADPDDIYQEGLLQLPLWFLRERQIELQKIIEQLKTNQEGTVEEKFVAELILALQVKNFNFDSLDAKQQKALLNLAVSTSETANYATSLLVTLMLRSQDISHRKDMLQLLQTGKANVVYEQQNFPLLMHKDLLKNIYIDFTYVNLTGIGKVNINFAGSDLSGVIGVGGNFKGSLFRYACLRAANFEAARLEHSDFTGGCFEAISLKRAKCKAIKVEDAYFAKADFTDADISNIHFENATLYLAIFIGSTLKLKETCFTKAQIDENKFLQEKYTQGAAKQVTATIDKKRHELYQKTCEFLAKEKLAMPDGDPSWPHDFDRWKQVDPWGNDVDYQWCELKPEDELYPIVEEFIRQTSDTMSYTSKSFEFARLKKAYEAGELWQFLECDAKQPPIHRGEIGSIYIDKIMVLRNSTLWKNYQVQKKELKNELHNHRVAKPVNQITWHSRGYLPALPVLNEELGECWLFHGTSQAVMQKIVSGGFSTKFATKKAIVGYGALGKGVYASDGFAKVATYVCCLNCGQNQCECDEQKQASKAVLLSRMLLGNVYVDRNKKRINEERAPTGYHSCWGPAQEFDSQSQFDCNEFALSDERMSYPEFCIFYHDNRFQLDKCKESKLKEKTYLPIPTEWAKAHSQNQYQILVKRLKDYYRLLSIGHVEEQLVYLNLIQKDIFDLQSSVVQNDLVSLQNHLEAEEKFLKAIIHQSKKIINTSIDALYQNHHYQIAYYFFKAGHYGRSIDYYNKVIDENPYAVMILIERAVAYKCLNQSSLFLRDINQAFQQQPEFVEKYLQDNPYFTYEEYYQVCLEQLEAGYQEIHAEAEFLKHLLRLLHAKLAALLANTDTDIEKQMVIRRLQDGLQAYQTQAILHAKIVVLWLRMGEILFTPFLSVAKLLEPKQHHFITEFAHLNEAGINIIYDYLSLIYLHTSIDINSSKLQHQLIIDIFTKLSEPNRQYFWTIATKLHKQHPSFYQLIANLLKNIRNSDGWSPALPIRHQAWIDRLETCFSEATEEDREKCRQGKLYLVELLDLAKPESNKLKLYRLHEKLYVEFFNDNQIRLDNEIQKQRHTVLPKNSLPDYPVCLKLLPENISAELLCYEIDMTLGGEHIPCGIPIKIIYQKQVLAAYFMEDVRVSTNQAQIYSLADTLEQAQKNNTTAENSLKQISSRSFTQTFLRVLLTNPEDDKGNDYFLTPTTESATGKLQYRLVRVDNERILHEGKDLTGKKPLVKSIIYLLNEMLTDDGLDRSVLNDFLALDMMAFLKRVFVSLARQQVYLQQLFSYSDIHQHYFDMSSISNQFNLRNTERCWLLSGYSEAKLLNVVKRLYAMQGFVELVNKTVINQPGLTLFSIIHYDIVHFYNTYFQKRNCYDFNKPSLAQTRFEKICKDYQLYDKKNGSLISNQQVTRVISQSMGLADEAINSATLKSIYDNQNMSPNFWLRNLKQLDITTKNLIGKDLINALFFGLPLDAETTLDPYEQTLLLMAIKKLIEATNQAKSILKNFSLIQLKSMDLGLLKNIITPDICSNLINKLKNTLETLVIDACAISSSNITEILTTCKKLKMLVLKNLDTQRWNFVNISFFPVTTSWSELILNLKKVSNLKVIIIENCPNLISLHISGFTHLHEFTVKNCNKLKQIKVQALNPEGKIDHLAIPSHITYASNIATKNTIRTDTEKSVLNEKQLMHKIVLITFYKQHATLLNKILTANFLTNASLIASTFIMCSVNDLDNISHKLEIWDMPGQEKYRSQKKIMFFRGSKYLLCGYALFDNFEDSKDVIKPTLEDYHEILPEKPIVILGNDYLPQRLFTNFSVDYIRSVKDQYELAHLHILDPEDKEFEALWIRQWLLAISLEANNWISILHDNLMQRFSQKFAKAFIFAKEFMVIEYDRKTAIEILQPLNFIQLDRFFSLIIKFQPEPENWVLQSYQENARRLLFVALSQQNLSVAQRVKHLITKGEILNYNRDHTVDKTMWRIMADELCFALKQQLTPHHYNFSGHYFNDEDLIKLAEGLENNTTLKELNLTNNIFTSIGINGNTKFLQALRKSKITKLENNFSSEHSEEVDDLLNNNNNQIYESESQNQNTFSVLRK